MGIIRIPSLSTFLFPRLFPGSTIIVDWLFSGWVFAVDHVHFVNLVDRDGWKAESPGSSLGTVVELHEPTIDGATAAGDVPSRLQDSLALGTAPDASHV